MAAQVFAILVTIVIAGWLWFYIVRPIFEDFGVVRPFEGVKSSDVVMWSAPVSVVADEQTDEADRPSVSEDNLEVPRLRLDRTKTTIIDVLVYNGWQTGEIRAALKGDNGVIGTEVEAARKRLGIDMPERTLRVRDGNRERVIPFNRS